MLDLSISQSEESQLMEVDLDKNTSGAQQENTAEQHDTQLSSSLGSPSSQSPTALSSTASSPTYHANKKRKILRPPSSSCRYQWNPQPLRQQHHQSHNQHLSSPSNPINNLTSHLASHGMEVAESMETNLHTPYAAVGKCQAVDLNKELIEEEDVSNAPNSTDKA